MKRWHERVLVAVFGASGAAGLAYQIVWTRQFALGLGGEFVAVLAVVTAFFTGLALGSGTSARLLRSTILPHRAYALLEALIALWGLITVAVIPSACAGVTRALGPEASAAWHWLVAFVLPGCVLLPSTMAMGATLPVMERWFAAVAARERVVGLVYAANTMGAVVGVLAAAFVVIPALGFSGAVAVLASINLVCAGVAWFMRPAWADGTQVLNHDLVTTASPGSAAISAASPQRSWLPVVAVTGFLGIGFEMAGVRVLAQVLENTIYTFATVLAVYLGGTAVGAALFSRWRERGVSKQAAAGGSVAALDLSGWLVALMASTVVAAWVMVAGRGLFRALRAGLGDSMLSVFVAECLVALAVFALPTLLMGAVFAGLAQALRSGRGGLGRVLAINTLGGAAAPIVLGAGAWPWLGAKGVLLMIVGGYGALAGWVWLRRARDESATNGAKALGVIRVRLAVGGGLALVLGAILPSSIPSFDVPPGADCVASREGAMESVAVVRHADGHRSLWVNHRFTMGGTGAAAAERRQAHLPLLMHPDPKRALFLGLGTGITFAACGLHEGLRADGVELLPEVVEVWPFFAPENTWAGSGPAGHVWVADARRFVRATRATYDVIVADLFHPARDGAGALYTRDHFAAIRERLQPGGIFCQWLPLYQLDEPTLQTITRTFLAVFPEASAWLLRWNVDTPVLGLVGAAEALRFSPEAWVKRVASPVLREGLLAVQLRDGLHWLGHFAGDAAALRAWAGAGRVATDNRPSVIFEAPRFNYERRATAYGRLLRFLAAMEPLADPARILLAGGVGVDSSEPFLTRLRAFRQARDLYLRGLVHEVEGQAAAAREAFVASARVSEAFTLGYAQVLTAAARLAGNDPARAVSLLEQLIEVRPERPVARQLLERMQAGAPLNPPEK